VTPRSRRMIKHRSHLASQARRPAARCCAQARCM